MKTIFLTAIFIAMAITVTAQDTMKFSDYAKETGQMTVAYLSFAPGDNGIGIRADVNGGYMSMSYGNYWLPYGGYIKDHTKIAMGFIYKDYSFGMSYHRNGGIKETLPLNKQTFRPISIEIGTRVFVKDWVVVALRYDVLRQEGIVDFGFLFPR